jgi:hypothetical protein
MNITPEFLTDASSTLYLDPFVLDENTPRSSVLRYRHACTDISAV